MQPIAIYGHEITI